MLFSSGSKFQSGSGWPSFYDKLEAEVTVDNLIDRTINLRQVRRGELGAGDCANAAAQQQEIHCPKCGGHLGHLFSDGVRWGVPTGKRYCVNGCALRFQETREAAGPTRSSSDQ